MDDILVWLAVIAVWILGSIAVGEYALNTKGRDSASWLIVSLLISPLIAFFIVAFLDPNNEADNSPFRKCPHCAEMVRREAKICRFCRYGLPAIEQPQQPQQTPVVVAEQPKEHGEEVQKPNIRFSPIIILAVFLGAVAIWQLPSIVAGMTGWDAKAKANYAQELKLNMQFEELSQETRAIKETQEKRAESMTTTARSKEEHGSTPRPSQPNPSEQDRLSAVLDKYTSKPTGFDAISTSGLPGISGTSERPATPNSTETRTHYEDVLKAIIGLQSIAIIEPASTHGFASNYQFLQRVQEVGRNINALPRPQSDQEKSAHELTYEFQAIYEDMGAISSAYLSWIDKADRWKAGIPIQMIGGDPPDPFALQNRPITKIVEQYKLSTLELEPTIKGLSKIKVVPISTIGEMQNQSKDVVAKLAEAISKIK